jgi:hypothetical protein
MKYICYIDADYVVSLIHRADVGDVSDVVEVQVAYIFRRQHESPKYWQHRPHYVV